MYLRFSRLLKTRLKALNSVPQTFADLFQLIHEQNGNLFCEQINDRIFVQKVSYWEMKRLALNTAALLKTQHHRARIGIKMRNSYMFIVMFWGIILSGNIPVLVNVEFNEAQINKVVTDLKIVEVFDNAKAKALYKQIMHKLPPTNFAYHEASDEIILMTTGTTGNVHYCSYSGKRVAAFINKTPYIVKEIPQMLSKKHIKHIVLLPLYHIFGLFTVYFWFAFFGMPFLFIDDILNDPLGNIRRYKVTHIFGVPALFKVVAAEILKEVKKQNMQAAFSDGLNKSIAVQTKFPRLNRYFIRRKFDPIIKKTFGYDIAMLIAGGATLDRETLKIFNGIGYDLITGYGATEVGITSINLRNDILGRLEPNIGTPLPGVTYKLDEKSVLHVQADTQADNVHDFFVTNDVCEVHNGVYSFLARSDEIVTLNNGENYNLNALQALNYGFELVVQYCFLPYENNIVFLFSTAEMSGEVITLAKHEVRTNKLLQQQKITKIMYTASPLRAGLKMINYREILQDLAAQKLRIFDLAELDEIKSSFTNGFDSTLLHVERIIKAVLNIKQPLSHDADLFLELGVSSFDYSVILNDINGYFHITDGFDLYAAFDPLPRTINEFAALIKKQHEDKA